MFCIQAPVVVLDTCANALNPSYAIDDNFNNPDVNLLFGISTLVPLTLNDPSSFRYLPYI